MACHDNLWEMTKLDIPSTSWISRGTHQYGNYAGYAVKNNRHDKVRDIVGRSLHNVQLRI
jgi:hypothetical protein